MGYRLVAVAWSSRWAFSYPSGAVSTDAVRGLIIPAGQGVSWAKIPWNLVSIRAAECFRSCSRLGRLSQRHSPEEMAETEMEFIWNRCRRLSARDVMTISR